jgi:hypothetical protein
MVNAIRIGDRMWHEVKETEAPLVEEKEFVERAKKYLSLLYNDFVFWITNLETDESVVPWSKSNSRQRDLIVSEYMRFFVE